MKRGILFVLILSVAIFSLNFVAAQVESQCNLRATLVNQDPYPAIPGDYVKLVFQLEGISNPSCNSVVFELLEEFPFTLDPDVSSKTAINAGVYARDYQSYATIPYRVRVDENALDGENKLEVSSSWGGSVQIEDFMIEIDDVRADFEVSIKDYDSTTKTITFEILNIAENDVEALTVEIPKQDNIQVKGSNREIVGSLDANDATTFSFEATPSDGEFSVDLIYTDAVNTRRKLTKTLSYDSEYFTGRISDQKSVSGWIYFFVIVVVLLVIWKINSVIKKRKKEKLRLHEKLERERMIHRK